MQRRQSLRLALLASTVLLCQQPVFADVTISGATNGGAAGSLQGPNGVGVNNYGSATGVFSTSIGVNSSATAQNASAYGQTAAASGTDSVAVGSLTVASGAGAT